MVYCKKEKNKSKAKDISYLCFDKIIAVNAKISVALDQLCQAPHVTMAIHPLSFLLTIGL